MLGVQHRDIQLAGRANVCSGFCSAGSYSAPGAVALLPARASLWGGSRHLQGSRHVACASEVSTSPRPKAPRAWRAPRVASVRPGPAQLLFAGGSETDRHTDRRTGKQTRAFGLFCAVSYVVRSSKTNPQRQPPWTPAFSEAAPAVTHGGAIKPEEKAAGASPKPPAQHFEPVPLQITLRATFPPNYLKRVTS